MTVQPCACGTNELDWPYDHSDFDPDDTNGVHCGVDENNDSLIWAYPGPEHGGFVAQKALASGIASGGWTVIPGPYSEPVGGTLFASGEFEAPRAGVYAVTWQFELSEDVVAVDAFDIYGRVSTDFVAASWDTPYLKAHDTTVLFLGGGINVSGDLPCLEGGTLTFELLHNRGSDAEFSDIYASAFWKCPIPS